MYKIKNLLYKMSKLGNFQKSIDAIVSFKPERAGIIQELQCNFTLILRIWEWNYGTATEAITSSVTKVPLHIIYLFYDGETM